MENDDIDLNGVRKLEGHKHGEKEQADREFPISLYFFSPVCARHG